MDVDTSNKPTLYPCRPSAQDPFSDRRLLSQHLISLFHLSNSRSCAIAQHVACPPACPTSDLQAPAADTSDMRVGPVAGANQNGYSRYRASPTEVYRNQSGQSAKRKWECKIGEGRCFSWIKLGGPGQCKHFLLQNMKENSHNGVRKIDQELAQERKDALTNGGRTPRCFASNSESDSNIDCPRFSLPRTVIGKGGDCETES